LGVNLKERDAVLQYLCFDPSPEVLVCQADVCIYIEWYPSTWERDGVPIEERSLGFFMVTWDDMGIHFPTPWEALIFVEELLA
jgi:hypothetical protein